MSLTVTRRFGAAYGGTEVRSPISKVWCTGSTVRVNSSASVGAALLG